MMRAVYSTVEKVARATDVNATAYQTGQILDALQSASRDVDALVSLGDEQRPAFAPWSGTIAFDWPTHDSRDAYRAWLDEFRLHSFTAVTSGGVDVYASALGWPASGPPYHALEVDTASASAFEIGDGTGQRSLSITGVWGTLGEDRARASWTLGASVSASADEWIINAPVGIGSIVLAGAERVIVSARAFADSGQTASALTASMADQAITVADGSAFLAGETIAIDGERMIVRAIVGNVLTVTRAADGSTLAAHASAAPVLWERACTVERAQLGTSASAHTSASALAIYRPPPLAEQLAIAYAIDRRAQEDVGYARSLSHIMDRGGLSAKRAGGDVGAIGIRALEERVIAAYGRIRLRSI
jgi:hypothetical protein